MADSCLDNNPFSLAFQMDSQIFAPEVLYLEGNAETYPLAKSILERFPDIPVRRIKETDSPLQEIRESSEDVFGAGKKRLLLTKFKGSFIKKCPGISPGMVCCNYYVVNLLKNCIYDCSYCFLQSFLDNNPLMVAYVNIEDFLAELEAVFSAHPDRVFRVGTGELTDSLALEGILPYSDYLIPFFNKTPNAVLELKTKSDRVQELLRQNDPSNVIVSWSLNPPEIISAEEKGTPPLEQRLNAARLCQEKGYRIGIHFDPLIHFPGWENAYEDLIDRLFATLSPENIEWISLGSFRYRRELKSIIKQRHRQSQLFNSEHVASKDGKFRYIRPIRNQMYEHIRDRLQERSRDLSIYMCMETKEVWESVTGKLPRSDEKLNQFFDR
jgi:spore photoproduct lyase